MRGTPLIETAPVIADHHLYDLGELAAVEPPADHGEQFCKALANPTFFQEGGLTHAAYSFNTQRADADEKPPLLFTPAYGYGADSFYGSRFLYDLTSQLNRKVISIDYPGTGQTSTPNPVQLYGLSLDKLAGMRTHILDRMHVSDVDLAGYCLGAALSAHMAVKLADRAQNLVTLFMPGFEPHFYEHLLDKYVSDLQLILGGQANDEIAAVTDATSSLDIPDALIQSRGEMTPYKWLILARLALAMSPTKRDSGARVRAALGVNPYGIAGVAQRLAPATGWHDITGTQDLLTSPQAHINATAGRSSEKNGSRALVLNQVRHGCRVKEMASLVEKLLGSSSET